MDINQLALVSNFVTVDHGKYIVKVSVYGNGVILGAALASAYTVEEAEDEARKRAMALINIGISSKITPKKDSVKVKTQIKPVEVVKKAEEEVITPNVSDLWENIPSFTETEASIKNDNNVENTSELMVDKFPKEKKEMIKNEETINLFNSDDISQNNNSEDDVILSSPSESQENLFSDSNVTLPLDNTEIVDFSQIIDQTTIEMKRLQWTQDEGKKYLLETYGKKSRHLLSDNELIEFLKYLKTQ